MRRANVWVSCTSQRGGEITNPGRGGSSLNRWTSHNSSGLERGTVPRQTRAVLAQATDTRSSRQAETLRATADEPTLLGSDGRPEGSTVRRPEGVSVLASQRRLATDNDPSAGSPTETLLRLLLPLNATVWSSSRQAVRVIRLPNSPRTSLKRSIGSSDGRCVQRAGT